MCSLFYNFILLDTFERYLKNMCLFLCEGSSSLLGSSIHWSCCGWDGIEFTKCPPQETANQKSKLCMKVLALPSQLVSKP